MMTSIMLDNQIENSEMIKNARQKAPNSFLLFCAKRRHESKIRGQYITSNQLSEEWKLMSKASPSGICSLDYLISVI